MNRSIKIAEPGLIKGKNSSLFEIGASARKIGDPDGTNTNIFGSATELIDVIKPRNGVKFRKDKKEIGDGKYIKNDPSKLSISEYRDMYE